MRTLEKLMVFALVAAGSAALVACDVEDDENGDGGVGGGAGGGGGDGGGEGGGEGGGAGGGGGGETFNFVYILDTSAEENQAGTPGVDICGVSAECDGDDLTGIDASLTAGAGDICQAGQPNCSTDRNNPNAALDNGSACEAGSNPSDYVSLGVDGSLAVEFARDLRGCSVQIIENTQGATPESYEVFICADASGVTCIDASAIATAPNGGNISFDVD